MTTGRYDVLIVNAETRIVSSVAAYALPLEAEGARPSAAATFTELCPGVRNGFEIAIVTAGQLRHGDTLPEHIVSRKPERPGKRIEGQTYTKNHRTRMADGNCVRCGDQAMDGLLCEPCARKNAQAQQERTAANNGSAI